MFFYLIFRGKLSNIIRYDSKRVLIKRKNRFQIHVDVFHQPKNIFSFQHDFVHYAKTTLFVEIMIIDGNITNPEEMLYVKVI